jgi:hypothetical protein
MRTQQLLAPRKCETHLCRCLRDARKRCHVPRVRPLQGVGVLVLGSGVRGLGFGGWDSGFGVWGLGFGVLGLGLRAWGLGDEVEEVTVTLRPAARGIFLFLVPLNFQA